MPPRPPPSPPVLTVLCAIAALAGVWLSLAVDQVARGLVGMLAGVPFLGLEISATHRFLPMALQGSATPPGPWLAACMALAGTVAIVALALVARALIGSMRTRGWLRGLALGWVVVALLWLPAALISAALPGGAGPVAELYRSLGDPLAGRWTAAALGLTLLVLAAGVISRMAVTDGKRWIRADSVDFRRRLVRVTAGWPGVVASAALALGAGWAPNPWAAALCVAVLGSLHVRTT